MQNNHKVWLQVRIGVKKGSCSLCFVFVFVFVFAFVFAFFLYLHLSLAMNPDWCEVGESCWVDGVVPPLTELLCAHRGSGDISPPEYPPPSPVVESTTWVSSTSTTHAKVFHIFEHILHKLKPGWFCTSKGEVSYPQESNHASIHTKVTACTYLSIFCTRGLLSEEGQPIFLLTEPHHEKYPPDQGDML